MRRVPTPALLPPPLLLIRAACRPHTKNVPSATLNPQPQRSTLAILARFAEAYLVADAIARLLGARDLLNLQ